MCRILHFSYKTNEIVNRGIVKFYKAIGLHDKIGSIKKGEMENLVIFDEDIKILRTIINGDTLHEVI